MAYLDNKKTLKYTHKIVFGLVDDPGTHDYITYDEMSEELAAYALKTEVPSKTSDLTNDTHFVTRNEMDVAIGAILDDVAFEEDIPVNLSELNNDEGFITLSDIPSIPTKTSDLTNDSGFITLSDIPAIPTKTSDLTNDSNFITLSDIPTIPTKTSDLTNDSGFLTTAVTSFNGSTGAITYTAPVTSVNGQTGVVSIDTGVTSFNGSTGAITYTAPVTSVNGSTGAVTVDVGVTSFNGSTGAVTYTAPVTSVNGQTGAVTVDAGGVEVYTVDYDDLNDNYRAMSPFQTIEAYYNAVNSGDIDCKLFVLKDEGYTYDEVIYINHYLDDSPSYYQSLYNIKTLHNTFQIKEEGSDENHYFYSFNTGAPYTETYTYLEYVSGDNLDADTFSSIDWSSIINYYGNLNTSNNNGYLQGKLYIYWSSGLIEEVISIQETQVPNYDTAITVLTVHYKYVVGYDYDSSTGTETYDVISKSTVCPTFTYDSTTNSLDITLI